MDLKKRNVFERHSKILVHINKETHKCFFNFKFMHFFIIKETLRFIELQAISLTLMKDLNFRLNAFQK